jgi:thymidylate synthase
MNQYLDLLQQCVNKGVRQKNRTGVDTFMMPGGMMQFDLQQGFPILTTKKVNFNAVKAELCGFLRGVESAKDFRQLGTKIWDANANGNDAWLKNPHRRGLDDLGRIYGAQWRRWQGLGADTEHWSIYKPKEVDQLARVLETIEKDPQSRRIIMSAWQPAELDQMALPPCHLLCQFLVEQLEGKLHATMYMRSCDMFLGVPFNITSYALLLGLIASVTGYRTGTLTMFLADVHIYENHLAQVKEQLSRIPKALPTLVYTGPTRLGAMPAVQWLELLEPSQLELTGYDPHPPIKADMAV